MGGVIACPLCLCLSVSDGPSVGRSLRRKGHAVGNGISGINQRREEQNTARVPGW